MPVQGDYQLKGKMDTSLGLMKNSDAEHTRLLSELPEVARQEARSSNLLILTKPIHYLEFIAQPILIMWVLSVLMTKVM